MLKVNFLNEQLTLDFGKKLSEICPSKCILFLQGELGAGKTTLVRGFLRGLGYQGIVKSPTYSLVEPYEIHNRRIFHFDLYRLEAEELEGVGIRDYLADEAICLIEWPEQGRLLLPPADVVCSIQVINQEERSAEIAAGTSLGDGVIERLRQALRTCA